MLNIFYTLKKSYQLKRISKNLARSINTGSIPSALTSVNVKQNALDELIALCRSDIHASALLNIYNVNDTALKEMYAALISIGAGQFVNGHFIAAASLLNPEALRYILEHYKEGTFHVEGQDAYSSGLFVAGRLLEFFK